MLPDIKNLPLWLKKLVSRKDLASTSDASKGSGMGGHNATLNYVAGTFGAVFNDVCVNVKMFPWLAKCDGTTNDIAAVTACITAISARGGGTILIPGPCRINSSVAGASNVTLKGLGSGSGFVQPALAAFDAITGTGLTGFCIEDLKITCGGLEGIGPFRAIRLVNCVASAIRRVRVYEADNTAIRLIDCQKCTLDDCEFDALSARVAAGTAPYAAVMDGCSGTVFSNCRASNVDFGFAILAAAYTGSESGRPVDDAVGNVIIGCTVKNHSACAFDVNGAHGNTISGCTSNVWVNKGAGNFGAFQLKNSTSGSKETRANVITGCTAYKPAIGFLAQDGSNGMLSDFTVRLSSREAVYLNGASFMQVSGVIADSFGSGSSGVGDQIAAVRVAASSNACQINNVTAKSATASYTRGVWIDNSTNTQVDGVMLLTSYNQVAGKDYDTGIYIDANSVNTILGQKISLGQCTYTTAELTDLANFASTVYPLQFSGIWDVTVSKTWAFSNVPQRGVIVGRVRLVTAGAITGSPTVQVGKVGSLNWLISATAPNATAGTQVAVNTSGLTNKTIDPTEYPVFNTPATGAAGTVVVSIEGLPRI